jgi:hypothetical protein
LVPVLSSGDFRTPSGIAAFVDLDTSMFGDGCS